MDDETVRADERAAAAERIWSGDAPPMPRAVAGRSPEYIWGYATSRAAMAAVEAVLNNGTSDIAELIRKGD